VFSTTRGIFQKAECVGFQARLILPAIADRLPFWKGFLAAA
jgi:hypothetical protein